MSLQPPFGRSYPPPSPTAALYRLRIPHAKGVVSCCPVVQHSLDPGSTPSSLCLPPGSCDLSLSPFRPPRQSAHSTMSSGDRSAFWLAGSMRGRAGPSLERPAGPAISSSGTSEGFPAGGRHGDVPGSRGIRGNKGRVQGGQADVAMGVGSGMERNGGIWGFLNTWN